MTTAPGPAHDEDEGTTAGDDDIVVDDRVHHLAAEIDRVTDIVDPTDRLAAARRLVDEMNEGD